MDAEVKVATAEHHEVEGCQAGVVTHAISIKVLQTLLQCVAKA